MTEAAARKAQRPARRLATAWAVYTDQDGNQHSLNPSQAAGVRAIIAQHPDEAWRLAGPAWKRVTA